MRKTYNGRTVVQDVSCPSPAAKSWACSANGAGKTTSFYMIVGLVPADAGRIEIDGDAITAMPIHKRARMGLSYLPQDASVFRRLTVEQNIRAVLELQLGPDGKPLPTAKINQQMESLLENCRSATSAATRPSAVGRRTRRVEIARALATSPRFILLDEPFAGVDPIAVIEIQRIVRFLKGRASACSSPTTTCAKRWASATAPTSSARARC